MQEIICKQDEIITSMNQLFYRTDAETIVKGFNEYKEYSKVEARLVGVDLPEAMEDREGDLFYLALVAKHTINKSSQEAVNNACRDFKAYVTAAIDLAGYNYWD